MGHIEDGELVIVHCLNPKEKLWGELERLDQIGVILRGLDLNSIEDWMRQLKNENDGYISPSTVFIPMHRIERVYLDESSLSAECFADRFAASVGEDIRDALRLSPGEKLRLDSTNPPEGSPQRD